MDDAGTIATTSMLVNRAPVPDAFPYVATRIVDSLHHILLLPRSWDAEHLLAFAQKQVDANKLATCLVLMPDLCFYFDADGILYRSDKIPRSVTFTTGKLVPAEPVPDCAELAIRRMELILEEESRLREATTIIMGNVTKGLYIHG